MLPLAPATAQSRPPAGAGSVELAKINGRAIAPVCPTLAQIRDFDGTQARRWSKSTLGCGHVLRGNFERAELVADSGAYVQLRFVRRNVPSTSSWMYEGDTARLMWTPRSRYVISATRK